MGHTQLFHDLNLPESLLCDMKIFLLQAPIMSFAEHPLCLGDVSTGCGHLLSDKSQPIILIRILSRSLLARVSLSTTHLGQSLVNKLDLIHLALLSKISLFTTHEIKINSKINSKINTKSLHLGVVMLLEAAGSTLDDTVEDSFPDAMAAAMASSIIDAVVAVVAMVVVVAMVAMVTVVNATP